jgi:hypothetical protein
MPKKHPTEVRGRAVRRALDRLNDYPSMWAEGKDLAPRLNIGAEALRNRATQAQADAASGPVRRVRSLRR